MALHYILRVQGRSGKVFKLSVYELDYVGATEDMELAESPIVQGLQAQSDDPFLPILASTVSISSVMEIFTSAIPNFLEADDTKYWGVLFNETDSISIWQGYILNDNVTVPFISGWPTLQFDLVDGLALLKDIPYEPGDPDINAQESLLNIIFNCLDQIGIEYYLNICVSFYAVGMQTRADGDEYEPFSQCYMPPRNWLKNSEEYISCYEVLEKILTGWGCQLVQSKGEWFISCINDRAEDEIYYTKYSDRMLISSGTIPLVRTVLPASNDDSVDVYFQEESQTKILRKGYSEVKMVYNPKYAPNYFDNSSLQRQTVPGTPDNWSIIDNGGFSTVIGSLGAQTAFVIDRGATVSGYTTIENTSAFKGWINDIMKISANLYPEGGSSPTPALYMIIGISNGIDDWYLVSEGLWATGLGIPVYAVPFGTTSLSIVTPPLPISGTVNIVFEAAYGIFDSFGAPLNSQPNIKIAAPTVTFESPYSSQSCTASTGINNKYKKEQAVEVGFQGEIDFNNAQQGSIMDASGETLTLWQRYPRLDNFGSMTRLILQQYFNIISKPSINFSASIRSLISYLDGAADKTTVFPFETFAVQDSTTNYLTVDGKRYVLGNSKFDYEQDKLDCTLIETSNTDIEATTTNQNIIK